MYLEPGELALFALMDNHRLQLVNGAPGVGERVVVVSPAEPQRTDSDQDLRSSQLRDDGVAPAK